MHPKNLHFAGGRLLFNGELVEQDLWVSEGRICEPLEKVECKVDARGLILSPGFIDLQINGAFGVDFSSQPERADEVAERLPQYGVTSFLATVISSSPSRYAAVFPQLRPKPGEGGAASRLGIHAEGPFLASGKRGVHPLEDLQADCGADEVLQACYGSLEGVKMVTLAPELPFALEMIRTLSKRGIVVAGGHSAAIYEQCLWASDAGVTMATHLFNGMAPFHHRDPGLVGLALLHKGLFFSMIADGIHCHPLALQLAWKVHPAGLILVSDAVSAMGVPKGTYRLGRQEIEASDQGALLVGTDTLAGSLLTMDSAVRNFHEMTGCAIADALTAATLRPAQALAMAHQKGTLAVGADADLVLLKPDLHVVSTYIAGCQVWS